MTEDDDLPEPTSLMAQLRQRVQREWTRALVRALTEPARDDDQGDTEADTPIERLAARAAAEAWPYAEGLVRPIFSRLAERDPTVAPVAERGRFSDERDDRALRPSPPARPAVWLSADEIAPLVGITAHTLRRLARAGKSPIIVRRMGGRWWFSRADVARVVRADAGPTPSASA